jgi:hypothetical protein
MFPIPTPNRVTQSLIGSFVSKVPIAVVRLSLSGAKLATWALGAAYFATLSRIPSFP